MEMHNAQTYPQSIVSALIKCFVDLKREKGESQMFYMYFWNVVWCVNLGYVDIMCMMLCLGRHMTYGFFCVIAFFSNM